VVLIRNFIELLSLLNRRAPGRALLPVQMDKLDIATTSRGHLGHLRDIRGHLRDIRGHLPSPPDPVGSLCENPTASVQR
jgi:hypothetical protein